jgi:hypothetical protein
LDEINAKGDAAMEHLSDNVTPQSGRRYPGFSSYKTRSPIVYHRRWLRDALIQSTLDPYVSSLESLPERFNCPPGIEFAFLVQRQTDRSILAVGVRDFPGFDGVVDGVKIESVTRTFLNLEPRASTGRAIWAQKRLSIDAGDRFRVVERLLECRETAVSDLVPVIRNGRIDPIHQLLAFIATGWLVLEIEKGFSPRSTVQLGPMAVSDGVQQPRK